MSMGLSLVFGIVVTFYGILNLLIYISFNEKRWRCVTGLICAISGTILLCHGLASL